MNKTELLDSIADSTNLSKAQVKKIFDGFLDVVAGTMQQGEKVVLRNFGTFGWESHKADDGNVVNDVCFRVSPTFTARCQREDAADEPPTGGEDIAPEGADEVDTRDVANESEAFGTLRSLLSGKPSEEAWEQIQACFEAWPESSPGRAVAMEYAQSHLASWPAELLKVDVRVYFEDVDFDCACPSLVRHIKMSARYGVDEDVVEELLGFEQVELLSIDVDQPEMDHIGELESISEAAKDTIIAAMKAFPSLQKGSFETCCQDIHLKDRYRYDGTLERGKAWQHREDWKAMAEAYEEEYQRYWREAFDEDDEEDDEDE